MDHEFVQPRRLQELNHNLPPDIIYHINVDDELFTGTD